MLAWSQWFQKILGVSMLRFDWRNLTWTYPLVMTNITIEHGPVEKVSFPIKKWWCSIVFGRLPEGKWRQKRQKIIWSISILRSRTAQVFMCTGSFPSSTSRLGVNSGGFGAKKASMKDDELTIYHGWYRFIVGIYGNAVVGFKGIKRYQQKLQKSLSFRIWL